MSLKALVADIGGTNTRLAVVENGVIERDKIQSFKNAAFASFNNILEQAFDTEPVQQLVVALAGPVEGRQGELTNLNWIIDADDIQSRWSLTQCALINDLQAQGWGAPLVAPDHKRLLVQGERDEGGTTLVLGIGTGCNIAVNHPAGHGRIVPAAEAGHMDLPVKCQADFDYLCYLERTGREVSVEGLFSGRGLLGCYEYFSQTPQTDAARIIAEAHENPQSAAGQTAAFMRRKLGDVLGDLALNHLPFGGIYLIGGVARALAAFQDDHLHAAFINKGRFAPFMGRFTIEVIDDDFAALEGLAAYLNSQ